MVKIDREKCIGCGLCADDCIALNIKIQDKKAPLGQTASNADTVWQSVPKAPFLSRNMTWQMLKRMIRKVSA